MEFDLAKNQSNKKKHGLYLKDTEQLDWDHLVVWEDAREEYGEMRQYGLTYGLTYLGDRIYAVVFTHDEEEDIYRIISLRQATKQEVKKYAET
ncbi:BrnT family toxin [Serratia inhibens]